MLMMFLAGTLVACDGDDGLVGDADDCAVDAGLFRDGGVGKDGIPALTDPTFVSAEEATYLEATNRVIGVVMDGEALAIPHNILWQHEIVNLNRGSEQLAITYCPLTGTSMTFDREAVGGGEFGVSGLLFKNNLTMYDRTSQESLWPQINREAGCGPRTEQPLPMVATIEMSWEGWQALHPDTRVVSAATGFFRNYTTSGYPYGTYEVPNNSRLLVPMDIDDRRLPKERVLGIPDGKGGGIAFPFMDLNRRRAQQVVETRVNNSNMVVFWDRALQGAMAFYPRINGEDKTFFIQDGLIVDEDTKTIWRADGLAIEGDLAGTRLEPVDEAFVAFWFAWEAFHPQTELWEDE